ncbi:MAG: sensor histidine kinase [Clostridium sp.]
MDIKSKSNNKYINTFLIILTFIVLSAVLISNYPKYEENKRTRLSEELSRNDVRDLIMESSYGIYYDMLKAHSETDPIYSIIDFEKETVDKDYLYKNSTNTISNYNNTLKNSKSLEYYALNRKGDVLSKSSDNTNIANLLSNDKDILATASKDYAFYIALNYDSDGNLNIINSSNKNDYYNNVFLQNTPIYINCNIDGSMVELNSINDMTYVFAIPNELTRYGYSSEIYINNYIFSTVMGNNSSFDASDLGINYLLAIIFVFLLALIIPFKMETNLVAIKKIFRIPFELLLILILPLILGTVSLLFITFQSYNEYRISDSLGQITAIASLTIFFIILFIIGVLIKHIIITGIWTYLKNNSLIIKFFRFIVRKLKSLYKRLTSFDFKNGVNKKLITLLFINFILVSLMSALWLFGIILAVIYTIVLFVIIGKKTKKISSDYNKLLKETEKLAKGDLESITPEDLGIFNDVKTELQSIESGFRKAVSDEVKSQKMKTELISNVSHDLKTPLTSIISYVALLKEDNLSEDKKLEYIDILDRKSQRLQMLIEDLFEVSKANSGNITLNIVDVDVVSVMKETLVELEDIIMDSNIDIKTKLSHSKIIIPLDSQRIYRVFENLIVNITKYAMKGSRAYINLIQLEDKVIIELKNMSADEITFNVDEIVERFARGDKSRNTEGSGIGLALAKTFVELQHGTFDIIVDGDLFKVLITFPIS